jgi:DNA-binding IclR family transcriptional regulator
MNRRLLHSPKPVGPLAGMPSTDLLTAKKDVKSAQRALEVLELLVHSETPLTFSEIGQELGYPRSSLFGLLNTLLSRHWLDFDEKTRKYRLGIRTFEAGNAYLRSIDLVQVARPRMERNRDELDEIVQISMLDGRYNVYLGKVEGGQHLRLASEVGRRLEAHATALGKMLLAGLSDEELARLDLPEPLERFTSSTITSHTALRAALRQARERGFATDDEEHTMGVRCVAVPIRDHTGRTIAALSVSIPTVRFSNERGQKALALLQTAVAAISRDLGYRP